VDQVHEKIDRQAHVRSIEYSSFVSRCLDLLSLLGVMTSRGNDDRYASLAARLQSGHGASRGGKIYEHINLYGKRQLGFQRQPVQRRANDLAHVAALVGVIRRF